MAGSALNIRMIRVDLLDEDHCDVDATPTVIWSTKETAEGVAENLGNFKIQPLHLTLGKCKGAIAISSLSKDSIKRHLLELAERAAAADKTFVRLVKAMLELPLAVGGEIPIPFTAGLHNSTIPMANVLMSCGFDFCNSKNIPPSEGTEPHISSMIQMSNLIDKLRKEQPADVQLLRKNDAIVFCPSVMAMMYKIQFWNQHLRSLTKYKREFVKSFLLRNKGYSNGVIAVDGNGFNPYDDPIVRPMLQMRQFELRYFTELIALVAVNQFAPAFRLPGAVMLHHGMLDEIYTLICSDKPSRTKELNKRVSAYGRQVKDEIGEDLWRAIFEDRKKLLLVCDFPAEWLPIDLVPAMFRYQITRVPSTPGNVTSHVLLSTPRHAIPCSSMNNVLVIRSFKENDIIRDHLTEAIKAYGLERVKVQFVDVETKEDVISAMNGFNGAIVVFDCHGNHGGKEEHGWLEIGKERLDVWTLANSARMPPIVILAACSTHAIDGSHASVANGFLRSGVLAVLGTYAPVQSIHAAVLVGRLLYRIDKFLPVRTMRYPVTWREIVSEFLKMSYVTDVLRELHQHIEVIDEEQYRTIHLEANEAINSGRDDWIINLQKHVMKATNQTEAEIIDLWEKNFQYVDTMLFTQLGRPENIILMSDIQFNTEYDEASE